MNSGRCASAWWSDLDSFLPTVGGLSCPEFCVRQGSIGSFFNTSPLTYRHRVAKCPPAELAPDPWLFTSFGRPGGGYTRVQNGSKTPHPSAFPHSQSVTQLDERECVMLENFQGWEIIIVLVIVLLLFGSTKLPDLARSIGASAKEFRKGLDKGMDDEESK
jgi:sec-independent protein translocase protein TatA